MCPVEASGIRRDVQISGTAPTHLGALSSSQERVWDWQQLASLILAPAWPSSEGLLLVERTSEFGVVAQCETSSYQPTSLENL